MRKHSSILRWLIRKQLGHRPLTLSLRKKRKRSKRTCSKRTCSKQKFKYKGCYQEHWIFRDASLVKICHPKPPHYPNVGTFYSWSTPCPRQVLEQIIFKHINDTMLISNLNDVYFLCANRNNSDYWCREGELTWKSIKPGFDKRDEIQKIIGFVMVSLERTLSKSILWIDLCQVMPYWRGHNFNQLLLDKLFDSIGQVEKIDAILPRNPAPNLGYWIHMSGWIVTSLFWTLKERCCKENQGDGGCQPCNDCESGRFQVCWIGNLAKHGRWDSRLSENVLKALC